MSENKTNFIMAVRGYKGIKKQQNANFTDITALDVSNNKVLLRIIEPLTSEFIGTSDVKKMIEAIKQENYNSAIFISRQFTNKALEEMNKENIQHISDDYMPSFDIQDLYLAIVNCANTQCQKKCGKVLLVIPECNGKAADFCKTKALVVSAKRHFEEGIVGLMKNDLKMALALT
jgi:hypothetical protein